MIDNAAARLLTDLELIGVAPVGVEGVRVDPLGADLEQLPHQVAHLWPLAEEGAVGVGRRRDARAVDLEERRSEGGRGEREIYYFLQSGASGQSRKVYKIMFWEVPLADWLIL